MGPRRGGALPRESIATAAAVVAVNVAMLVTMGRAVALLAVALVLAYVVWLAQPVLDPRRVLLAYVFAVLVQVLHLIEEYRTGFYREFPPLLGAQPWSRSAFLIFNLAWLLAFVLAAGGLARRWRPAAVVALFLALGGGVLNGLGHFALAARSGAYFPGLYTAPLSVVAGSYLALRMLRRSVP
jgi:hypothetical protein